MSVDVGALLHELDVRVAEGATATTWLLRTSDGSAFEVEPTAPANRVNAVQVRSAERHRSSEPGRLLHVGESATPGVVERAKAGEIDLLTAEPIRLIHSGRSFDVETVPQSRQRPQHTGKHPWVRWALERYLLLAPQPSRQSQIARSLGTTQQSISRAAQALNGLVADDGEGLVAADRSRLLEHWRDEYPGPGGQEFGWYSLDPVMELTGRVVDVAALLEVGTLVSGDVAADVIAPWKLPASARIYISAPVDLADDGFASVPLEEANVVTCIPRDPTLWRLGALMEEDPESDDLPLADAAIVYWDVFMSGDQDSDEAAQQLAYRLTGGNR